MHRLPLWLMALVCAAGSGPGAGSAAAGAPAVLHQGRSGHDLRAWGRARQLVLSWNAASRVVHLTNRTSRLALAVDSQQAVVNGIKVWLIQPVAARPEGWWLSARDAERVLEPLLQPRVGAPAGPVRTIVLDPGHGGRDPGHQTGSLQEKRLTLLLAQQVRAKLQAAGYRVVLTRTRDTYLDLAERAARANREKADLFVSLHFNAAADRTVRGVEVFCLTPNGAASTHAPRTAVLTQTLPGHRHGARSQRLAYEVQKALVERGLLADRGVKHARFAVLRDLTMPGILVEAGFLSHPEEARQIADPKFRDRLAAAIVAGIERYRRLTPAVQTAAVGP